MTHRLLCVLCLLHPGRAAGTLLYSAPEQLLGEPCTRAADVYSLGMLMLAVITGRQPVRRGEHSTPR